MKQLLQGITSMELQHGTTISKFWVFKYQFCFIFSKIFFFKSERPKLWLDHVCATYNGMIQSKAIIKFHRYLYCNMQG